MSDTARDRNADCVIVGSGINSLVCAAGLARRGRRVIVLERNDRPGGCIRTEEATVPGFHHDTLSGFHPLFVTSPGYAALGEALHAQGLEYANTDTPTGVILPDGSHFILSRDRGRNIETMNALAAGDGERFDAAMNAVAAHADTTFTLLGSELKSWGVAKTLFRHGRREGHRGLIRYFGESMESARTWLERTFESGHLRACLAPWILHTGLGPDSALGGHMLRLIAFTLEGAGMPVVRGGSERLVDAFRGVVEANGGRFVTGADVDRVVVEGGRARGVETTAGERYTAGRAVVCSTTPTQLYGRLLRDAAVPARVRDDAARYRYGRGCMQIHLALDEPPEWPDPALREVAMLHLTPGLDGVSRAVNEAERGLLPAEASVVVAQPTALDPSRAPEGKWILWIQLQELPRHIRGDAAGSIPAPADGAWDEATREAYADRIVARLAAHVPNLERALLGRRVLSPADLEAMNINLVGGDPYAGDCQADQFLLWRPLNDGDGHRTCIRGLHHIGASTHPGPGLGGVSGHLVAERLG
ncbi:NAD(P)/FAD-dependent oxidoreductase [Arhodomonas aquaeolei]|uniref:phytoene desaturase family protein n=1 Tax=Arhodomonas aquaeolei TaxID=2369 RepID=UPI00216A46E2|nr:NAD(P)/FAD-dependent oxidoreductase [Arhodomonas aquaeolei]MCS4503949.1 NAD(P)/FAD-dependent oxidoreductase [Arhodomonas aquaeolei]